MGTPSSPSLSPFSLPQRRPRPRPQTLDLKLLNSDFAQSLLPAFRAANPHMDVLEEVRAGQHPFLRGEYREF